MKVVGIISVLSMGLLSSACGVTPKSNRSKQDKETVQESKLSLDDLEGYEESMFDYDGSQDENLSQDNSSTRGTEEEQGRDELAESQADSYGGSDCQASDLPIELPGLGWEINSNGAAQGIIHYSYSHRNGDTRLTDSLTVEFACIYGAWRKYKESETQSAVTETDLANGTAFNYGVYSNIPISRGKEWYILSRGEITEFNPESGTVVSTQEIHRSESGKDFSFSGYDSSSNKTVWGSHKKVSTFDFISQESDLYGYVVENITEHVRAGGSGIAKEITEKKAWQQGTDVEAQTTRTVVKNYLSSDFTVTGSFTDPHKPCSASVNESYTMHTFSSQSGYDDLREGEYLAMAFIDSARMGGTPANCY